MPNLDDYPFELRRLSADEGGGWLIRYPDFDECLSDGETIEEAISTPAPAPAPRSTLQSRDTLPERLRRELADAAAARGMAADELMLSLLHQGLRSAA